MKKSFLILSFFITSLLACSAEPASSPPASSSSNEEPTAETPAPRMIQPGETTVAMGSLKVSDESVDDDSADGDCDNPDCTVVYDMCRVMAPFPDAMAIVEYKDREFHQVDRNDCSDHHRTSYSRRGFKTLGVVAGKAVPEELTVTTYAWDQTARPLSPGDTFLVSLHEINGEWFASFDYTVTLGEDVFVEDVDPTRDYTVILDIPMSFEGLVEEAEAVLADYEPCRSRSYPFWTSRQKMYDFLATSGPRCGGPTFPADPAYPEDSPNPDEQGEGGE